MLKTFKSDLSLKTYPEAEKISGNSVRASVIKLIQIDNPDFTENSFLSYNELNKYRRKYISEVVSKQIGSITDLEKTVLNSIANQTTISNKVEEEDIVSTFGEKIADKVANFGGSWTFIITFLTIILIWIGLNILLLLNKGFDPYPFILLNLVLSCLAALQAPVIMMSQSRQSGKDRDRAKKDYMVNLKSELEIRSLHEKLDHLIIHQQQDLMEIQNVQIEMLNDLLEHANKKVL